MHKLRIRHRLIAAAMLLVGAMWATNESTLTAQLVNLKQEAYLTPPKEIADAVTSRSETVLLTNLSPDGKKFLITKNDGLPSVKRMGHSHVYLGGVAFDPVAGRAHDLWVRSNVGFDLFFPADKRTVPVQVPDKARVSNPAWSPDGSKLAFFAHFDDATHIYIADTQTGSSRRLTTTPVLATMVTSFQWSKDGKRIQTVLPPDDGKREMPKNGEATEPKVRVTRGGANPSRTYRFLLESPHDMKMLEFVATGQLAVIDIADGHVSKIGFPDLIRSVSMAPSDDHFRVTTMKKPFSYYVPMTRFGSKEGIWNQEGKTLYTILDRNLRETDVQVATQRPQAGSPGPGSQRGGFGGRQGRGQGQGTQVAGQQRQTDPTDPPNDPVQPQQPNPTRPTDPTQPNPNPTDPDDPLNFRPTVDPSAKRDITWRPDGAGLSCLQLEPERKDANEPRKDQVLQWQAPFGKDDAKVIYSTPNRISSLQYSDDCKLMFLTQTVDSQRQITAIEVADPKVQYVIYRSGGPRTSSPEQAATPTSAPAATPATPTKPDEHDDDEQQPGRGAGGRGFPRTAGGFTLLAKSGRGESNVVRISSAGDVFVTGTDRSRDANTLPKPYIDKVNIKTGKKTRIFEGKGDMLETIDAVDGDEVTTVFTTRQNKEVPPNSYMTDLKSGTSTKLTNNIDHTPWFHQLQTQRFQVTRVDGFKFWVKVTLPPKAPGKLPALFWIYPREYTDQASYNASAGRSQGGMGGGAGRFATPSPRSMTLLTLLGYAVVEPDVPIVGPAGRMNDNYVSDLRNSLWAVIDDLDKKGIIDRDRLAVGGHSYGAFSTANALAHTPFFKAGIAGDGNYNRTLTMMTFQTERRQLWDARETYLEMSPLLWANRVNGALLMYHGMDDANVGTNPVNAEHMFMALDGLGKPAALYMYPYEGHGPLAKETTLDLWARWIGWLDMYVKNPKKDTSQPSSERSAGP